MISFCNTIIDKQKQEVLEHGTTEFPIGCYFDDLLLQSIPWHWHEELEVGIVRTGSIVISTPNSRNKLMQGDCFFINSGVLHRIQNQDSNECHVDTLVFHARLLGGNMDSVFWRKFIRPVTSNPGITLLCFGKKGKEQQARMITSSWLACLDGEYGFEIHVRHLLSQLVLYIHKEEQQAEPFDSNKMLHYNERAKKMLTYIREHYQENITIQAIAGSVSISESECLRCFRKVLGISPIAYVKMHRLQNAAELISTTRWKISYIAQQCGFSEMSYFSKSFRETYHCTPSEYRSMSQD